MGNIDSEKIYKDTSKDHLLEKKNVTERQDVRAHSNFAPQKIDADSDHASTDTDLYDRVYENLDENLDELRQHVTTTSDDSNFFDADTSIIKSSQTEPELEPNSTSFESEPAPEPTPTEPYQTQSTFKQNRSISQVEPNNQNFILYSACALVLILFALVATYINEHSSKINQLNERLTTVSSGDSELGVMALDQRMTTLEDQFITLSESISALSSAITDPHNRPIDTKQINRLQNKIDKLEYNLLKIQSNINHIAKNVKPASSKQVSWSINIAALSNKDNAQILLHKVTNLGANAHMDTINVNGKPLWRIRALGYASKEAASQESKRLKTALNMTGLWVKQNIQ
jgi:uncharacterized coiled-coil protein SlyX